MRYLICLILTLASAPDYARDLPPQGELVARWQPFTANYDMKTSWFRKGWAEAIDVSLARQNEDTVVLTLAVHNAGETNKDTMIFDANHGYLRRRQFSSQDGSRRFDVRFSNGELTIGITDGASGKTTSRSHPLARAYDASMIDYVLAMHVGGEEVLRVPYYTLGNPAKVQWATAKPGGWEKRETAAGTIRCRRMQVNYENGDERTFCLTDQPPYKVFAETNMEWRLRSFTTNQRQKARRSPQQ